MKIVFRAFGPFELTRQAGHISRKDIKEMWARVDVGNEQMKSAIDVYIVARKHGRNPLVPWYVGKTDKRFRKRFNQHFAGGRSFIDLSEIAPNGNLQVFLIARTTAKGTFRKPMAKDKHLKSIDRLEFMLIGSCLKLNPEKLVNKSNKSFHRELRVPGYVNYKKSESDNAAKKLARMLAGR